MLGRVLGALPSTFVAAGFTGRAVVTDAPLSLRTVIGELAFWWGWAVVVISLAVAITAFLPPTRRNMRVEVVVRIVAATLIAGYVVGLLSQPQAWISAGMALAVAAHHVVIWREIEVYRIPLLRIESEVRASLAAEDDHV